MISIVDNMKSSVDIPKAKQEDLNVVSNTA